MTNKNSSSNGPQLPMPGSRNNQDPNAAARHSKLRNGSNNNQGAQLQQINVSGSGKANKKASQSRDGGPLGEIPQKQVKPSELSLDLIIPSSIRGAKQSPMSGANHTNKQPATLHNSSVNAPMLVNLRTP